MAEALWKGRHTDQAAAAGLNPDTDITIVVAGEGAQPAIMLKNKQVDALSQFDTQYALIEIAGVKLKRNYNLSAPKGVNGRNSDNTLIRKLLGWAPSTRLKDGMAKTYAWIYDQIVNDRPCPVY